MTPMRWAADECVSRSIVENLRAEGHDVLFVADGFRGKTDEFVFLLAASEGRLLLTQDSDFGELLFRRISLNVPGIVFIRIPPERAALRWPRLKAVIDKIGETLFGRIVVIEEQRTRSRALNPVV